MSPAGYLRLTSLQEEPLNNGAWTYVGPRIYTAGRETQNHKGKYPHYAGRGPTSSVATGSKVSRKTHSLSSSAHCYFYLDAAQEGDRGILGHRICRIITGDINLYRCSHSTMHSQEIC